MLKQPLQLLPHQLNYTTNSYHFPLCRRSGLLLTQWRKPLIKINYQKAKEVKAVMAPGDSSGGGSGSNLTTKTSKISEKVKAILTIQQTTLGGFVSGALDGLIDFLGKSILLELVSDHLDPKTESEKRIKGYAHKKENKEKEVHYEATFEIPQDFGKVGAIVVENEHHSEMFLKNIVIDGFSNAQSSLHFTCNSWIHSKQDSSHNRIFFTDKSYLPSETPSGLRKLREEDLELVRGNGEGERKKFERIYDYDVYNDLGAPDINTDLKRPVLGGSKQHPYPRRCRTGRKLSDADSLSESKSVSMYVPRDEAFGERKQRQFIETTASSGFDAITQSINSVATDLGLVFSSFDDINMLFKDGFTIPHTEASGLLLSIIPKILQSVSDTTQVLRFETPETFKRDRFFWFSDEEFARQTLAGVNPYSIKLVKEWPLRSKLDPQIYGAPESAITSEVIEQLINGYKSVEEAIEEKKLFMLDYHDLLLPFVAKVRELDGTTLYGSRTLFFLTTHGTLKPLAIELTRPPINGKPQWKQVFIPSGHSTNLWLWRLAKAHVLAHDSGYHELVSHWLRTHSAVEPFIIATHRQLSTMHPIYRLLHPHLRYTMEINALARQVLISANGIIEIAFSPQKYSMELSSAAYDQEWQFDLQALPNDLIHRGMAVEDPSAPHGLKLTIEDYPFANDGLLIWDALKSWVTDYISHYYPNPTLITSDPELQSWWSEIRTVGHGDKQHFPWWPSLQTPTDLIQIVTTIAWVASAHHAAVNFTQYAYGGYFPNRPTIARTKMPSEDPTEEEWDKFVNAPEIALLECFPSQIQATVVMAVLNLLSEHSPDEEYIGDFVEAAWGESESVKKAFERFQKRLKEIEGIIDERNKDSELKNRNGVGILPYEVMKPFSGPGVTGKGIPYSISI